MDYSGLASNVPTTCVRDAATVQDKETAREHIERVSQHLPQYWCSRKYWKLSQDEKKWQEDRITLIQKRCVTNIDSPGVGTVVTVGIAVVSCCTMGTGVGLMVLKAVMIASVKNYLGLG